MKEKKTVGIWIRVSTEDQARGESPETHERRARMYAELKGWEVATVYHLEGVSGKVAMEHGEAGRMLADVKAGRIDALIFSKLARLARDTRHLLEVAEHFRDAGADLISLGESIDTSTPAGRLFYTVIAAMAQWEREEVSDRVKASVKTRAKLGKPLGGAAPFGFRWEEGKLVPEESEAAVARELFEIFLRERRVKTTARLLNGAGYRTRKGGRFTHTTVKRLLENPVMKGKHRLNYTESLGEGRAWKVKPEEEWEFADVPAIVGEDVWTEANTFLSERKKKRAKRPGRKSEHLFGGLVLCHCGTKMYVLSGSTKYVCQACRNKIPAEALETVFLSRLAEFLSSPEETESYLSEASERLENKRALLASLKRDVSTVEREMADLFSLYRDGGLSAEGFRRRNEPLEERLASLGEEIPRVEGEISFLEIEEMGSMDLVEQAGAIVEGWKEIPFEDRRVIVEHLLERVEIADGTISFSIYNRPDTPTPPSPEVAATGQHNLRGSSRRPG